MISIFKMTVADFFVFVFVELANIPTAGTNAAGFVLVSVLELSVMFKMKGRMI